MSETFLSDSEARLAAEIGRRFDQARAARRQKRSPFDAPAFTGFEDDLAIAQASSVADAINKSRMNAENAAATAAARGAGGSSGFGGGGGGFGNAAVPRVPSVTSPATTGKNNTLAAIEALFKFAPYLLGNDTMKQIMQKGIIGWLRGSDGSIVGRTADGRLLPTMTAPDGTLTIKDEPYTAYSDAYGRTLGAGSDPDPFAGYRDGFEFDPNTDFNADYSYASTGGDITYPYDPSAGVDPNWDWWGY